MQNGIAGQDALANDTAAAYYDSALRGARHGVTRDLLVFVISTWEKPSAAVAESPKDDETGFYFCHSPLEITSLRDENVRQNNASTSLGDSDFGEGPPGQAYSWSANIPTLGAERSSTGPFANASTSSDVMDKNQQHNGTREGDVTSAAKSSPPGKALHRSDFVQVMSTNRERLVVTTRELRKVSPMK